MFTFGVLLLFIFGSGFAICREYRKLRHGTCQSTHNHVGNLRDRFVVPSHVIRPLEEDLPSRLPFLSWQHAYHMVASSRVNDVRIVREWKTGVRNLIRHATLQMAEAQKRWMLNNVVGAAFAAAEGVEKMSRALLHCYGVKPESNFGQAEALRLLLAITKESLNENLGKSVAFMEKLTALKTSTGLPNRATAKQIYDEATKTFELYKQTIQDKFGTEINEQTPQFQKPKP